MYLDDLVIGSGYLMILCWKIGLCLDDFITGHRYVQWCRRKSTARGLY